jgi:predicted ester cyclase
MSEQNKQLVRRWFEEVWNEGRRETVAEVLTPDAVIQEGSAASVGPEGFYPFFDRIHAAFSGIHVILHDMIAEDDRVFVRWSCIMWHTGEGLGMPPTNKGIEVSGMSLVRIANGRFVAAWQNWDMLGMLQQISGESMAPTYIAANTKRAGSG